MSFLDNSGDIILDAVLTDAGRKRLARADGTFKIAKFALGDDEIDYSLYNYNNISGSAYYDLEILQTPVLEAFSNNASSMKSKLLTITKNNLLYLPTIKINSLVAPVSPATQLVNNGYVLAVDTDTETYLNGDASYFGTNLNRTGILNGRDFINGGFIRVDQGLDTSEIPVGPLDADLIETQFLVEIDNRFGSIASVNGERAVPSYIDDDNMASYRFSRGVDTAFVNNLVNQADLSNQVIAGPRGTYLQFKIVSQNEVSTSDYLFTQLGKDLTAGCNDPAVTNIRGILTNVRVTCLTTGNAIDIPLMIIKKIAP